MSKVYLLDGAVETALGSLSDGLFEALLSEKRPPSAIDRFDTSGLAVTSAACIDTLNTDQAQSENLTQVLTGRVLAELTHYPEVGAIIWAGVKSNAEFIEQGGWSGAPASSYPHLPRHYSRWIRHRLGYKNSQLLETGAACASSTVGMALAAGLIASGRHSSVLVVATDIVSRFSLTGFNSLFALSNSQCRPFDIDRDGLLLGDGAAAVLLAGEDYIKDVGVTPMARLSGWGVANDATHITAPARDGRGLIAAITAAMRNANAQPDEIGAFCAHGTGTVYNDAMELTALENIFDHRHFPVFSIKGALGHTLGAAGGIEALVCAKALAEGVVPPTTGLRQPEPKARGRISPRKQPFENANKRILTSNSGFGGVNAALILERTRT